MKNILLTDRHQRPIATDIHFNDRAGKRPVVIYAHGFNGFKDWGGFDLIANEFAEAGITFVKFNFSFNGTTPDAPEEFVDLRAYSENNYTKELDNLQEVIDWTLAEDNPFSDFIDAEAVGLCGHSRGGGIVLLKSAEEARVKAVCTWASVAVCQSPWGPWPLARLDAWKVKGIDYVENSRTKQQMPLKYQLYEDFQNNKERLSIERAIKRLQIPILLIHGTADTSVPIEHAQRLKEWQPAAELFSLDTDHVFGRRHPWNNEHLRLPMQMVIDRTVDFFRKSLE